MRYIVVLDIGAKEDDSGVFPDGASVRSYLRDHLGDITKHDETIGWRLERVESLPQAIGGGSVP